MKRIVKLIIAAKKKIRVNIFAPGLKMVLYAVVKQDIL